MLHTFKTTFAPQMVEKPAKNVKSFTQDYQAKCNKLNKGGRRLFKSNHFFSLMARLIFIYKFHIKFASLCTIPAITEYHIFRILFKYFPPILCFDLLSCTGIFFPHSIYSIISFHILWRCQVKALKIISCFHYFYQHFSISEIK